MAQRATYKRNSSNAFIDGSLALKLESQRQQRRTANARAQQQRYARENSLYDEALEQERQKRRRRYEMERQRRHLEETRRQRQLAEEERQAQIRMAQQSRRRKMAAVVLLIVMCVAGFAFVLLYRQAQVEKLMVQTSSLNAQIKESTKRIEEMEVKLNSKSNISQLHAYARENLDMDFPTAENTRVVSLP